MGLPLRSPVAKLSCEAATEENAKSFMPRTQVTGKANFSPGITSGFPVLHSQSREAPMIDCEQGRAMCLPLSGGDQRVVTVGRGYVNVLKSRLAQDLPQFVRRILLAFRIYHHRHRKGCGC